MQQLGKWLPVLVAGFALGWLARGWTVEEHGERTARRTTPAAGRTAEQPADATGTDEPFSGRKAAPPAAGDPDASEAAPVTGEAETAGGKPAEDDPLAAWVRSQRSVWKGMTTMQAKQKLKGLFAALGLDEETTAEIEARVLAEVERQTDLAIDMMLGEGEMDADAFAYFLGLPPDLTPELERELATFLDDDEIDGVRQEVKKAYKQQLTDLADMQIGMMAVSDLSDDQRTRLREVYSGKNVMQEQFAGFAELTRDRRKLTVMMEEGAFQGMMKTQLAPTRERVRRILSDAQFESYEAYEQQVIAQAQMGMKMMTSMLKPKTTSGTGTTPGR